MKKPSHEEFKVEGDKVTHAPTGKCYEAEPASAEITSENVVELGDYQESDIRQIAKQLLADRVRISERLR
jgi:hypothetical protein